MRGRGGTSAVGAVLGGALWAVHAAALARRPEGCVASACALPGATHRPSEDLAWLVLLAVVLMAAASTSLLDRRPRGGRLLRVGTALLWTGAGLLVVGLVVNAVLPGDSPLWWLHDSDSLGRMFPVVGSLMIGIGVLRNGGGVRWAGGLLVVSAVASLPVNVQDDRVLLDLPLGLAWCLLGLLWRSGAGNEDVHHPAQRIAGEPAHRRGVRLR